MDTKVIDREASDSYKGFPYQKKKTANRILELYNKKDSFVVIPEYLDDIYVQLDDKLELTQVKKSDSKQFTLNTPDVYKSIVCFLDAYFKNKKGSILSFCLYTNTSIGQEKGHEGSLIEILKNKNFDNDTTLGIIKDNIIRRYKEVYDANKLVDLGYLKHIEIMPLNEWKDFFSRIDFSFQADDEKALRESSIKLIKESTEYTPYHAGREEDILNELLSNIDDKMAKKYVFERIINKEGVSLIFEKKKNISALKMPMRSSLDNEIWKQIENEKEEKRNLEEKIISVCSQINPRLLRIYKMNASTTITELSHLSQSKEVALKQKIYLLMEEFAYRNITETKNYSSNEIEKLVESWQNYCVNKINEYKKDFDFGFQNDEVIKNIVLSMIDQCYHKFEVEEFV